jgi:hypothetical protein
MKHILSGQLDIWTSGQRRMVDTYEKYTVRRLVLSISREHTRLLMQMDGTKALVRNMREMKKEVVKFDETVGAVPAI